MKMFKVGLAVIVAIFIVMTSGFGNTRMCKTENVTEEIELSREEILDAKQSDYSLDEQIKWDEYCQHSLSVHDGIIPIDKLSDPIYLSMNLPSETRSDDMIRGGRDNGFVMAQMQENHSVIQGIGAIYKTTEATLPKEFTLCIGKIKTFAYLKSIDNWVLIDEQAYPAGVYLYKLPWTEHYSKECKNIKKFDDHIEVKITANEFNNYVLHFWGKMRQVDRTDILYVACAYDFWIKEPGCDGVFTATIGIDTKDSKGSQESIKQLFTGRGLSVTSERRTQWGHTIPNNEYESVRDGITLKVLYEKWWNISSSKK